MQQHLKDAKYGEQLKVGEVTVNSYYETAIFLVKIIDSIFSYYSHYKFFYNFI
ncbi:hypothetical protein [Rickettsia endosymbiont of Orchestes rusci]|uniref:hypothetical protein n=1 Tax=Rickettsia endosymbiont of Orchestes rusci TaxID=3066250 RepID=UPI00313DC4AA